MIDAERHVILTSKGRQTFASCTIRAIQERKLFESDADPELQKNFRTELHYCSVLLQAHLFLSAEVRCVNFLVKFTHSQHQREEQVLRPAEANFRIGAKWSAKIH